MKIPKILRADNLLILGSKGVYPGVEGGFTPDGPDVLDAGDGVAGVGGYGLASGCRVRRVDPEFLGAR